MFPRFSASPIDRVPRIARVAMIAKGVGLPG